MREPGLRWTRQRRHETVAGRAGSPCESENRVRTNGAVRLVSSVSFRLRRQGREYCGDMAGRAYGKTVWSWPSLLRSSCRGGVCEPNRADSIVNSRSEGGQRESSAPGRARHKPSDHRAGKAECSAPPVCCCAVLLRFLSRSGPRVRGRHPVFPAPSWLKRAERPGKARAKCAAGMRSRVCCLSMSRARGDHRHGDDRVSDGDADVARHQPHPREQMESGRGSASVLRN
jgi:hypothetical protein